MELPFMYPFASGTPEPAHMGAKKQTKEDATKAKSPDINARTTTAGTKPASAITVAVTMLNLSPMRPVSISAINQPTIAMETAIRTVEAHMTYHGIWCTSGAAMSTFPTIFALENLERSLFEPSCHDARPADAEPSSAFVF
jgi:hypothetical protein